jgi:hypothetical protein
LLELKRLNSVEFDILEKQWQVYFDGDQSYLFDHCKPHLEHARSICSEDPHDPRYGIYALISSSDGTYEGFTHVNHKLPRTADSEVRLVWNTLSPVYETALDSERLALFTASYIFGAINLARGELRSNSVRIYLGNGTDRQYAQGIVVSMREKLGEKSPIEFAGNWLHIREIELIDEVSGA